MKKTTKHCSLLDERIKCRPLKRMTLHILSTEEQTTKAGNSVKKNTFIAYDPAKSLRSLSVQDFTIQSLMSVGADLHQTSLSLDNHASVDNLKASLSALDNQINNLKQ